MNIKLKLMSALLALTTLPAYPQQVPDLDFHFANDIPAFEKGQGPTVCIDEAHKNFHTADGGYAPFAKLLRSDGFRVKNFKSTFSLESLKSCYLLIIVNASALEPDAKWTYPHDSAFTGVELEAVMLWVRGGGNLFLIADHPPMSGAAAGLGAVLGIVMPNVFARQEPDACMDCDFFTLKDGTLHDHAIIRGRNAEESVNKVSTISGQPVHITQYWQPLLTFGDKAMAYILDRQIFQQMQSRDEYPQFSIAGWTHAATREWDKGRIVFMGEAAACSAQVYGKDKLPFGMNYPEAEQNAQFCLNTVRWLARVL